MSSIAVLALVIASPVMALPHSRDDPILRRNNTIDICSFHLDDSNLDLAASAWTDSGAADWLDNWLASAPDKESKWTMNLYEDIFGGASPWDCGDMDTTCAPNYGICRDYVEKYPDDPESYWVWFAVQKTYNFYNYMWGKLQAQTLSDALKIPDINDDFGDPTGDLNLLSLISSVLVMGTAVGGAVAGPLNAWVGALGIANSFTHTIDTEKAMTNQLSQVYDHFSKTLTDQLALALDGEGDVNTLPDQSGDYQMATSRFLAGGKFLVQDIGGFLDPMLDAAHQRLVQSMVVVALKSTQHFVYVDEETSEEDCNDLGAAWTSVGCANLMKWTSGAPYCRDGESILAITGRAGSSGLKTMTEPKYGFDYHETWQNAIDCAIDNPDGGAIDLSNVPTDGSLPPCLFNFDVVKGINDGKALIPNDINTVYDDVCGGDD